MSYFNQISQLNTSGGCSSSNKCGQGEGDCDNNSDCVDGLWCDYDGWWDTDYCKAGMSYIKYERH